MRAPIQKEMAVSVANVLGLLPAVIKELKGLETEAAGKPALAHRLGSGSLLFEAVHRLVFEMVDGAVRKAEQIVRLI